MRKVMPLHPIDESVLLDLAHGLMREHEKEPVLAHLHACAECENRFRELVSQRETARAALPAHLASTPGSAGSRSRAFRVGWIAAVASAAMIAAVVIARLGADHDRTEYWIPIAEETAVLRSANESSVSPALEDYARRDAQAAILKLQALDVPAEDETATGLRDLFLASALVNAGRYEEGERVLEGLTIHTLPTQWRRQARWVRYLALTGLNRDADARQLLDVLVDEPGDIGRLAREEQERRR